MKNSIQKNCTLLYSVQILGSDGETDVGMITKQWPDTCMEMCTNFNTFTIKFPVDLDVATKATLLGAVFLVDFMYFQYKNSNS